MTRFTEIATKLAIDSKASGIDDFGCLYDDDWKLTDAEWQQVCDEAEQLLPTVEVPAATYAAWSRASADVRAEQAAERRAFSAE